MTTTVLEFPSPGDTVKMRRTMGQISIESKVAEGAQGIIFRTMDKAGTSFAVKWYRQSKFITDQLKTVEELVHIGRPHEAFIWPIDIVKSPRSMGFGYLMPWVEPRFISLIEVLNSKIQPSFRTKIEIALRLVEAFSRLHSLGLCYRDISFGNLLVDPFSREIAIVDNDNIGTELSKTFIKGTLRFMAPEIVCARARPSIITDLYSLSVFLFYLFFHGHPLIGRKYYESLNWVNFQEDLETKLNVEFFGTKPLFIFDPQDESNRPEPDDPVNMWWRLYPKFVKDSFVAAFTQGLREPSFSSRFTEHRWRLALYNLADCLGVCNCGALRFYDPDNSGLKCWKCSKINNFKFRITIGKHTIMASDGAKIRSSHLFGDFNYDKVFGVIEKNLQNPKELLLRNTSNLTWELKIPQSQLKSLGPNDSIALARMQAIINDVTVNIS